MSSRRERKALRALYDARFALAADILRAWDPYRLLSLDGPLDEVDGAITRVVSRWDELRSPAEAARVIAEVFGHAFDPQDFSAEACALVGERLWAAIQRTPDGAPPPHEPRP